MRMPVDMFFKISKYYGFRLNDDFDRKPNKTNRQSIQTLTFDEASDSFGFSPKEDLDLRLYFKQSSLREYIRGKYENKE